MYKQSKYVQKGFTLTELIIVIVILGILVAVAAPRYLSVSSDAQQAAVAGVAGALSAASATNYGTRTASPTQGIAVTNCQNIGTLLTGGLPAGYSITSLAIAAGTDAVCTVTGTSSGKTATFTATGIN